MGANVCAHDQDSRLQVKHSVSRGGRKGRKLFTLIKMFDRQLKRTSDLQSIIDVRQHRQDVVTFHRTSLMDSS